MGERVLRIAFLELFQPGSTIFRECIMRHDPQQDRWIGGEKVGSLPQVMRVVRHAVCGHETLGVCSVQLNERFGLGGAEH